ncbi:MAG: hypothetical protein A2014_11355 [Spirochaetes bacterium GWF1_49_6]|nr:MAG: hypothetical protein A2014_11355 [Spirochaetes bacterium GWF1_49_6]
MHDSNGFSLFSSPPPPDLKFIVETLKYAGFEAYLVGGAVRDLIHRQVHHIEQIPEMDFDFATNADPQKIISVFSGKRIFTIPTGLQHGTVTVVLNGKNYEITTYRIDGSYADGRHPDHVRFSSSLEEDLARRDFTVNAIAYDILESRIIDPFGGTDDIRAKVIRTVGDPKARFSEDALRLMRACRIAAYMGYTIEERTLNAVRESAPNIKKVSPERIQEELMKLMKADIPSTGLEYLRDTGLLKLILPELTEGADVDQNEYHLYDVYRHNIYACDAVPKEKPLLRIAALFHDIGKPRSKDYALRIGNGNVFYNHEIIGAKMAHHVLKRLRFSNHASAYITDMVKNHMFYYTEEWTDGAVRRFLRKINGDPELLNDLFLLRKADRTASGVRKGDTSILERFRRRIEEIMQKDNALKVTDLALDGYAIMESFKIKPGKIIGELLNHLLEKVLDNPELNTPEELLKIGGEYLAHPPQASPHDEVDILI